MFGRACGWGTGLILLTSPLTWFHSEIALTTIVDSALVVSYVFVCWRAIHSKVTWFQTIMLAVLLAAVGGVRQHSAPLLIPLWMYVFCGFAQPRAPQVRVRDRVGWQSLPPLVHADDKIGWRPRWVQRFVA